MSILAIIISSIFCLYVISGLIVFLWGTRRYKPGRRGRLVTRLADRKVLFKDEPFTLRLFVRGKGIPTHSEQRYYRVVLVIDRSSSMGGNSPGSRLSKAKEACIKFVNSVNLKTCNVGVVCYDDDVETLSDITDSKISLMKSIEHIRGGGATDIALGITRAGELLTATKKEGTEEIIVLLSDGYPYNGRDVDVPEVLELGDQIKKEGVRIICIGIGETNEEFMKELASHKPGSAGIKEYYNATDKDDLVKFYETIAESLQEPIGTRALITESVNDRAFMVGNYSVIHIPESINLQSWEIQWFMPYISTSDQEIPFQLIPYRYGWHKINPRPAEMHWHDMDYIEQPVAKSNNNPHALVLPSFAWWVWFILANPIFWIILSKIRLFKTGVKIEPLPERKEFPSLSVTLSELVKREEEILLEFRPTLVVGLGYTGRWILTYLKKMLTDLNMGDFPHDRIRLLCIDSESNGDVDQINFAGATLTHEEIFHLPDDLYHFHNKIFFSSPEYLNWYEQERMNNLNRESFDLSNGTKRFRQLGRLSFYKTMHDNGASYPSEWENALSFIEKMAEQEQCQLFFAGSTVGGTSGGIFLDIACCFGLHLKEKRHIPTYSFICSRTSFRPRDEDQDIYNLNTLAFLREWERFIVNGDFPLKIRYSEGFDQVSQGAIFDHNFLFDPSHTGKEMHMLYPMVADIMSQLIPLSNPLREYIDREINPEATQLTAETNRAVVINAGCRSIKLPVTNIIKYLRTRLMFELFCSQFLRLELKNELFVPSNDIPGTHIGLKELFIGHPIQSPLPPVFSLIPYLADFSLSDSDSIHQWQRALTEIELQRHGEPTDQYIKKSLILSLRRILGWALYILNGDAKALKEERKGGIIRLILHLSKLEEMLIKIPMNLKRIPLQELPYADQLYFEEWKVDTLLKIIESYYVVVGALNTQVKRWLFCMADGFPKNDQRNIPSDFKGLTRQLYEQLNIEKKNLEECLKIEAIKYSSDKPFLDHLYKLHFAGVIEDQEYLCRFEWKINEQRFNDIDVSFWEMDISQVSELNLEGILELNIHSETTKAFQYPINNKEILDSLLEIAELGDDPKRYLNAFAGLVDQKKSDDFLNQQPFMKGPGINNQGDFIKILLSSKGFKELPNIRANEQFNNFYPAPCSQGVISLETQIPITDTLSYKQSITSYEEGDHNIPYVFSEEKTAYALEEFYNQHIERLNKRFSPRLVHYFGHMDRLLQFLYLLLNNEIKKRVPSHEPDSCLSIEWDGQIYYLTKGQDQLDLEKAMAAYIIMQCDVFYSSISLPDIEYDPLKLVKLATELLKGAFPFDEEIKVNEMFLAEIKMFLQIIEYAGIPLCI